MLNLPASVQIFFLRDASGPCGAALILWLRWCAPHLGKSPQSGHFIYFSEQGRGLHQSALLGQRRICALVQAVTERYV